MSTPDIRIMGTGVTLPGAPVGSERLADLLGMNAQWAQWVDAFIGTHSRHLAIDLGTGKPTATLADLAALAAAKALAAASLGGGDIDLVVMATSMPDDLMPATVNVVADRLGIDGVPSFQIQSGCSGAFQALQVAAHALRSGDHRSVLVIGGDRVGKHLDLSMDFGRLPPNELVSLVLFGDGAGAVVLSTGGRTGAPVLRDVHTKLTGRGRPAGHTVRWFGMADRHEGLPFSEEDYQAIQERVPVMSAEIVEDVLARTGWTRAEISHVLPPQLSGAMTPKILERLGLPGAREVGCVAETGNVGNATPFFQLERVLPEMVAGDRAVAVSVESSKWIRAGLAVEKD